MVKKTESVIMIDLTQFNKDLATLGIKVTYTMVVYIGDTYRIITSKGEEIGGSREDKEKIIAHLLSKQPFLPITGEEMNHGYLFIETGLAADVMEKLKILLRSISFSMDKYMLEERMQSCSLGILDSAVNAIEAKDVYTKGHSDRVAGLAQLIAERMDLPYSEKEVAQAGLLHDIGKIGISERILTKPGSLTDEEYQIIKSHPEKGAQILEPLVMFKKSAAAVRHHHERYDGKGYPDGLAGEEIPLLARVIAVSDAFDAMTSDRPYRKAFSYDIARQKILSASGTQFDPAVVEAFNSIEEKKISSVIGLRG